MCCLYKRCCKSIRIICRNKLCLYLVKCSPQQNISSTILVGTYRKEVYILCCVQTICKMIRFFYKKIDEVLYEFPAKFYSYLSNTKFSQQNLLLIVNSNFNNIRLIIVRISLLMTYWQKRPCIMRLSFCIVPSCVDEDVVQRVLLDV